MRKEAFFFTLTALFLTSYAFSGDSAPKQFEGSGEVVSSDPVYSRVTLKHKPIEGFVGGDETEFVVASPKLLKEINRHDLVEFTIEDKKGDVRITKITKTGVATPKRDSLPLGEAVQDVLVKTGQAASTVTAPIPGVGQVVSGAAGATTDTTEPILEQAKPEVKTRF